jgi:hypothetical protein
MKIVTKKIKIEDFSPEIRKEISKLAWSLNPLFDQLETLINRKGLTVEDNLPFKYQEVTLELNASSEPKERVILPNPFGNNFKGFIVTNVTDSGTITGAPYISWEFSNSSILVKKVLGLPQDTKYTLTLLLLS